MTLTLYPEDYAVCQLAASAAVPDWANDGRFNSISKTEDELSIVCESTLIKGDIRAEKGWRTFKLHGPFAFDELGIIASLTTPLAKAGVGVFVISTFNTDYLMVKAAQLQETLMVLENHHNVKKL